MFEYTIKAYNQDQTIGAIDIIRVVVQAANEDQAILRARQIADRTSYAVEGIKDLGGKFNKLPAAGNLKKGK